MVLPAEQFFQIRNGVLVPASIPFPRWTRLASGLPGPVGIVPTIQPVVVLEDPTTLDTGVSIGAGSKEATFVIQMISPNITLVNNITNQPQELEKSLDLLSQIHLWFAHAGVLAVRTSGLSNNSGFIAFDDIGTGLGNSAIRGPGYLVDATLFVDSDSQITADLFRGVIELDGVNVELAHVTEIRDLDPAASGDKPMSMSLGALLMRDITAFQNTTRFYFGTPGRLFYRKMRIGGQTSANPQITTGRWRFGVYTPSVATLVGDFSLDAVG